MNHIKIKHFPRLTPEQFRVCLKSHRGSPVVDAARDVLVSGRGMAVACDQHSVLQPNVSAKVKLMLERHREILGAYDPEKAKALREWEES